MVTIVGGSGKIGSKTARLLLAEGHKVRLLARKIDNLKPLQELGADIVVGDATDENFLIDAFDDADLIVSMIPSDIIIKNLKEHQDNLSIAQCNAIVKANVKRVINISSLGAHDDKNTGIVTGLARHEVRLNALPGIDVLHLRPTYFMENLFAQLYSIKNMNAIISSLEPDYKFPMISTDDIAVELSRIIIKDNFRGKMVYFLLGAKDYSMRDATHILGKTIGKPDLQYMQVSYDDLKKGLLQAGITESVAEGYVGLEKAINSKILFEPRTKQNTTNTTLEDFAKTFALVYKSM